MVVRSLRSRLLALWLMSLAASVAVGVLLVQLYQLSATAQAARAEAAVARACDLLRDRYGAYAAGWAGPAPPPGDERFRHDLAAAAWLALSGQDGVEGGYWQAGIGALAYAFPTYRGTGPKTDLPAAELGAIADANAEAARTEAGAVRVARSASQTLLLQACPVTVGPVPGLTAWAMARSLSAPGYGRLQWGLGVLAALAAEHEALATEKGVTLQVEAAHVPVRLDPRPLGRCLGNLVQNAIQHAPPGGWVAVRAEAADALRFTVEDSGPGIHPALVSSLFEPFVTGRPDGTGLGLAIAREMAEAQGGRLVLRRAGGDGTGAAFVLELPEEAGWRVS